jgi:hypothetical protein
MYSITSQAMAFKLVEEGLQGLMGKFIWYAACVALCSILIAVKCSSERQCDSALFETELVFFFQQASPSGHPAVGTIQESVWLTLNPTSLSVDLSHRVVSRANAYSRPYQAEGETFQPISARAAGPRLEARVSLYLFNELANHHLPSPHI